MTAAAVGVARRAGWQRFAQVVRRVVLGELHGYQSIVRFVLGRPRVPVGAVGFGYHQPILSVLIVLISVSAVELVVVDLIVHSWPAIRIPLLILGLWGVVWMLGMLFGVLTRPHAVGSDGIRARYAAETDIPLSWDDVYSVTRRRQARRESEGPVTVDSDGEQTLHLRIANETNIEIELERALPVKTPRGRPSVRRVAIWVDDPTGFMAEVRRWIG